jgi:hypothetical protein
LTLTLQQSPNGPRFTMATLSTDLLIQDPRLEDYLNDKFQSLVDLDNVDSLLSSVQSQQNILRQQVCTTPQWGNAGKGSSNQLTELIARNG